MEKLDLYDINKVRTGKTYNRGERVPEGYYRLVVHCCIFNNEGKLLIQKRSRNKSKWASLWDVSVGGSAQAGESSQEAIVREVKEELGIDVDLLKTAPRVSIFFDYGFNDIYIINKDIDIKDITIQLEEVEEAKFASLEEIKSMMETGEFVGYLPYLMDFLFEYRKTLNIYKEEVKNIG